MEKHNVFVIFMKWLFYYFLTDSVILITSFLDICKIFAFTAGWVVLFPMVVSHS